MKGTKVKKAALAVMTKMIQVGAKEYLDGPPWCMGILHQPQRPSNIKKK